MKRQVGGDFTGMLLILILLMVVGGVGGLVAWKMNLFGLGGGGDSDDDDDDDDDNDSNQQPDNSPPAGGVVITKSSEITQPTGECSADDVDGDPCTLKNFSGEPKLSGLSGETLTALLKTPGDDGSCDTGYVKVNPTTFLYSSTDPDPQNDWRRKACRCLFSKPDVAPSYKCTQDVEFYKQDGRDNLTMNYRLPDANFSHGAGWKTTTIFDALKYSEHE